MVRLGTAPARRAASSGTAERFASRVRARRRRRIAVLVAAVAVLAGLGWLVLFSPYLVLQQVQVRGTDRVAPAEVHAAADREVGRPMVLLDPSAVARRVAAVELVRSVQVRRSWPATLTVTVVEREPVAAVPVTGEGFSLVDRDGVEVERVERRPAEVPVLTVDLSSGSRRSVAALAACLDVLGELPPEVSARLVEVGADSPDGVWLRLAPPAAGDPVEVVWGGATEAEQKARVLGVLLSARDTRDAAVLDVSAPLSPAVRTR